jgi:hypothetical protein
MIRILWIVIIIIIICLFFYVKSPNLQSDNNSVPIYKRDIGFFPDLKNTKRVTIICTSGLSNRIRTILGFLQVCKRKNKKLTVIWLKDGACNGKFKDYFKPIPGVRITSKIKGKIHFTGQSTIEEITEHYNLKQQKGLYCNIQLIPRIENEINMFVKEHNIKYTIGIHVRRTDLTGTYTARCLNGGTSSDSQFYKFIKLNSKNKPFFIATDNKKTQDNYSKKYKKVLFYSYVKESNNLRQTTLEAAIIDIYILSYCKKIKGTVNSSFSDFSRELKKARQYSFHHIN